MRVVWCDKRQAYVGLPYCQLIKKNCVYRGHSKSFIFDSIQEVLKRDPSAVIERPKKCFINGNFIGKR
jgi:hypothetical protein